MHDTKNNQLVPITEFLTTSNDTNSISKFLFSFRKIIEQNSLNRSEFIFSPIIVTDFSWALIKSIMDIFNNCSITNYLTWTYDLLVKNKSNVCINTILILCSTHFLKLIIRKTKTIKTTDNVRKTFLFSFTLLQNSQTIEQFNLYLMNIFYLFNQRYNNIKIQSCFELLKNEVYFRKIKTYDISDDDLKRSDPFKQIIDFENSYFADSGHDDIIYRTSPFKYYYDDYIKELKSSLILDFQDQKMEINEFYSPELFQIIQRYLYLMPLWTSLMINNRKKLYGVCMKTVPNRLTNNAVESYFGHLKNNILFNRRMTTSELVGLLFNRIRSIHIKMFESLETKIKKTDNYSKYNVDEKWMDKNKIKRKNKSYYYQSNANFGDFLGQDLKVEENFDKSKLINNQTKTDEQNEIRIENSNIKAFYNSIQSKPFISLYNRFQYHSETFKKMIEQIRNYSFHAYNGQKLDNDFRDVIFVNDLDDYKAIYTKKDGNCFYSCISQILYGTEDHYYLVKVLSLFIMFEYKEFFSELLLIEHYGFNFETLITELSREFSWANQLMILACSIMLNTGIYCFSIDLKTKIPNNRLYDVSNSGKNPLFILYKHNHFVSLSSVNNNFNKLIRPVENYYGFVKDEFVIKTYQN